MKRQTALKKFVIHSGYEKWSFEPLTADASFRNYQRGTLGADTVILMDAPPENGEDIGPFLKVTQHLKAMGFSPPSIHAFDPELGFIIMEDFGDNLVATHCKTHPEDEMQIYKSAIDILAHSKTTPAPDDLPPYDRATYHREANLVLDWYCDPLPAETVLEFAQALDAALGRLSRHHDVLVQRDYHAENLIWRPEQSGFEKLGLLDFQDALKGHPVYDLVSLLEDARREVAPEVKEELVTYAVEEMDMDRLALIQDMAILGAQRNLKIIGIFARLWRRDGKPKYPPMIPHVHNLLLGDLAHPATVELSEWCKLHLPDPSENRLADMMRSR